MARSQVRHFSAAEDARLGLSGSEKLMNCLSAPADREKAKSNLFFSIKDWTAESVLFPSRSGGWQFSHAFSAASQFFASFLADIRNEVGRSAEGLRRNLSHKKSKSKIAIY